MSLFINKSYSCVINLAKKGKSCPANLDSCHHGTCRMQNNRPVCKCNRGYVGVFCRFLDRGKEKTLSFKKCYANICLDPCVPNLCQNRGQCISKRPQKNKPRKAECKCRRGYSGSYCGMSFWRLSAILLC